MSANLKLLSLPFVAAVLDPTVIPHVYDACDQWCTYCPVTSRCLAYRCRPEGASPHGRQAIYENIAARLSESLTVIGDLRGAGAGQHPAIARVLTARPEADIQELAAPDPLEQMGRRYAIEAARYLASRPEAPFAYPPRPDGPTPAEVLAWFSSLIHVKIYRALVSWQAVVRGQGARALDAQRSARVASLGIERSRAAIATLRQADGDPRLAFLDAQLHRLAPELEGRFPAAATTIRPGLDGPLPVGSSMN